MKVRNEKVSVKKVEKAPKKDKKKIGFKKKKKEMEKKEVKKATPIKKAALYEEQGLINGRGLVNGSGLVNGNGLTNGLGMVNGKYVDAKTLIKHGFVNGEQLRVGKANMLFDFDRNREIKKISYKNRYIQILGTIAIFLMIILPFIAYHFSSGEGIVIDGNFTDWENENSTIVVNGDMMYLHLRNISPRSGEYFYEVISSVNGVPGEVKNLSAYHFHEGDILLIFPGGKSGQPYKATYRIYLGGDPLSPDSWTQPIDLRYAFGGGEAELALYIPSGFQVRGNYMAIGFTRSSDGDRVIPPASTWSNSSLLVKENWVAPKIIKETKTKIMTIGLEACGGDVTVRGIRFNSPDYTKYKANVEIEGYNGRFYMENLTYVFNNPLIVRAGGSLSLDVWGEFEKFNGSTIYYGVASLDTEAPYSFDFSPITVSYVGNPPSEPIVDGGFEEWKNTKEDSVNDTLHPQNLNSSELSESADINRYGRIRYGGSSYFYVSVTGEILRGTYIGNKKGLEVSKAEERIASSSPKPTSPVSNDEDVVYIGVDMDNSTETGYLWEGVGVDYLIEIRGKMQRVSTTTLEKYEGGKWIPLNESIEVAVSNHGLELSAPGYLKGRYVVYINNWLNIWDVAYEESTRATDVTDHVVINEIYIGKDYYIHWIELYNPTDSDIDISNWNIVNIAKFPVGVIYTFPSNTIIKAKSYLTVDDRDVTFQNNNVSGSKLSIALYDSSGNQVDSNPSTDPVASESFARYWDADNNAPTDEWYWDSTPSEDKQNDTIPELNSQFLILLAIGGAYGVARKRKEKK